VNRGTAPWGRSPRPSHPSPWGGTAPALRGEAGAGSVTVLVTVLASLALMGATLALGGAATAAARAGAAADLAALAAADADRGLVAAEPCALARQTAERHGSTAVDCTVEGGGTVRVRTSHPTALPWPAQGESRAGPPGATGPLPPAGRWP
jgi:secretion/DNA translocation related TadE-like protein